MAFLLTVALGPVFIPILRKMKFGQTVRGDGLRAHLRKTGTPTMGGLLFLLPITVITIFLAEATVETFTALFITLGHGVIGFVDDYIKVVMRRPLGLKARHKLVAQAALGLVLALVAVFFLGRQGEVFIPGWGGYLQLGWWYVPFVVVFMVIGFANAVNLTDGLDGLAAGVTVVAALALMAISALAGRSDLAIFAGTVAGGCLGFLVFNRHPARVFMGDTGSLALGAALASLAVLGGTELMLPIVGGIYVAEALSVVLQVLSFRLTGKRIFRMSPLHHHFELLGWAEPRVVRTFWTVGLVLGLLGVLTLY
ncbi:phospho-N-acetylmuramoyl-pentapeptide-transferase [Clostridiales bacterium PH28_bin88]|nr:phospho-N-acetylmuramoyl-pentapeptide-transferase [Clostridiales bacterium PH28_bin88]